MQYRFFKLFNQHKYWVTHCTDWKVYFSVRRSEATLFTELDWLQWAQAEGLEREEVAEAMKISAPMLPGLD